MIPVFPFDDSLKLLNTRQTPPRQTPRGNYEWSWLLAGFVTANFVPAAIAWSPSIVPPGQPVPRPQVLLFGADVPHLQAFVSGYTEPDTFAKDIRAYAGPNPPNATFNSFAATLRSWSALAYPPGIVAPTPSAFLTPAPSVCDNNTSVATRATLLPSWGVTSDAGQGALVSCSYTNTDGDETFVQGFPLDLPRAQCGPLVTDFAPFEVRGALWVGYSSAINHGLGNANPTPDQTVPTQPAYIPILYPRANYTAAIRANNNVITVGTNQFRVMGLWANN
jgi:hypothetical protein